MAIAILLTAFSLCHPTATCGARSFLRLFALVIGRRSDSRSRYLLWCFYFLPPKVELRSRTLVCSIFVKSKGLVSNEHFIVCRTWSVQQIQVPSPAPEASKYGPDRTSNLVQEQCCQFLSPGQGADQPIDTSSLTESSKKPLSYSERLKSQFPYTTALNSSS